MRNWRLRRPTSGAFSLIELLVVLVLLGLAVGIVAPSLIRPASISAQKRQLDALAAILASRRVEAVQAGGVVEVTLTLDDEALLIAWWVPSAAEPSGPAPPKERELQVRRVEPWRFTMETAPDEPASEVSIRFGPHGRTRMQSLWFRSRDQADRIWSVRFDVISGAPSVVFQQGR